jgi:putative restriction endonuclease
MKFYVAVTDDSWFYHLRDLNPPPDEVNFWTPGLQPVPHAVGTPWLFKLHSPNNFIVGGGYFMHYSQMPLNIAWEAFEQKNGVTSVNDLQRAIARYRKQPASLTSPIGCVVLSEPFIWPRDRWLPVPENWAPNIVTRKQYFTESEPGKSLWLAVNERLPKAASVLQQQPGVPARGKSQLVLPRLGQGGFRLVVTDAYARRCAVTGERTLPALEAAHIKQFSIIQSHDVRNGLLLRADIHRLYDAGYVTIGPNFQFLVSKRIHADFDNGKEYYALSGRSIELPSSKADRPDPQYLEYHAINVYKG